MLNPHHLTEQEARSLQGLGSHKDYLELVSHLHRRRDSLLDKLTQGTNPHDLYRIQGRIQELDEILELPKRALDYISRSK